MMNRFRSRSGFSSTSKTQRLAVPQSRATTLLDALHAAYTSGYIVHLDASTTLAVNTCLNTSAPKAGEESAASFDRGLAVKVWEHARRRAEDNCIILASLHQSTPSVFAPFLSTLPVETPHIVQTALSALRPFFSCATPYNPSTLRHSSLAATFALSLSGDLTALTLALSNSRIDVEHGLLQVPAERGYRAFDVFYYLLSSAATPAEREFLGLDSSSTYSLLNKSVTYVPPADLPDVDSSAAETFRSSLKAIGIKGATYRGLLSVLAGILKLGNATGFLVDEETLEDICEAASDLLGVEPEILACGLNTNEREVFIAILYEALVDWVILQANIAIDAEIHASTEWSKRNDDKGDTVNITVIEISGNTLGKAIALRTAFDDDSGINEEMKDDGLEMPPASPSILQEMLNVWSEVDHDVGLGVSSSVIEDSQRKDQKERVLAKVTLQADADELLKQLFDTTRGQVWGKGTSRFDLFSILTSSRAWYHLFLHPTDDLPSDGASLPSATSAWSAATISRQIGDWHLADWTERRDKRLDFTADFGFEEFTKRYAPLGCQEGRDGIESWILERGWSNGEVIVGIERVWMRESAWWEVESMLDLKLAPFDLPFASAFNEHGANPFETSDPTSFQLASYGGYFPPIAEEEGYDSDRAIREDLLGYRQSPIKSKPELRSLTARMSWPAHMRQGEHAVSYNGVEERDDPYYDDDIGQYNGELDPEIGDAKKIETQPISISRRFWVGIVHVLTFWVPSPFLKYIGRMKRPDVRMAWREKVVLVMLIFLLNATVIFYIIYFGRLLCPNYDKAWNSKQLSYHQGADDFYVSIHGKVYDISNFWQRQHSDTSTKTTKANMESFGGENLDAYFPPPISRACSNLKVDDTVIMLNNDTGAIQDSTAVHYSGPILETSTTTALHSWNWYYGTFIPKISEYYKGELVVTRDSVRKQAKVDQRYWVILNDNIYDLTNYFYTLEIDDGLSTYDFFPSSVTDLFKAYKGEDVTHLWKTTTAFEDSLQCLNNAFYMGKVDFRETPKCQVNNYILLGFTIILCSVMLVKFLAALQLGSKRRPVPQNKFVICQVPAYTEGEDQLRKSLDSLTALHYDNQRRLICVICDGMITGDGNDRPTPKIVLDILGVDPKIDPPALPFRSVGTDSDQLNYAKVYSGLYEHDGNVVPYIVIVKVGKESEQTRAKAGNRGKRDSQILLLRFLNRVHYRSPMNPLELEMFHQINNIIGVDPELYEYLLMVDADTSVREDSLNRLVANCANDSKIAGICGETSLENEQKSWWTMIQVYEYYISHHLAKSFESLFGTVTCLPGCFCLYRLRTSYRGRPLIISDKVISEYSDGQVDTLHKKNLLALGEDRYLTTIMTKHFPAMSYKFTPEAYALTAAPERWSVLLSQRRRWINSTMHNLFELIFLRDLCGFCCFSMRFVVFIDLFGTIILPATCGYLVYLIYRVSSHSGAFPLISIVMVAAVYGLQAIIFIIKRQWQHVGWMIIYILAFPMYSVILPIYSFWNQDNFSWGNTRVVIGERGSKQVVAVDDEGFDPRSIPLQRWDQYAAANGLPGVRGSPVAEKNYHDDEYVDDPGYEMEDMHNTYSKVKPASTIFSGFPYLQSSRASSLPHSYSRVGPSHHASFTGLDQSQNSGALPYGRQNSIRDDVIRGSKASVNRPSMVGMPSDSDRSSPSNSGQPRSKSIDQTQGSFRIGPEDLAIIDAVQLCLNEVDLETATKKQVRALVEQRLDTNLVGERKIFLDRHIDLELANM